MLEKVLPTRAERPTDAMAAVLYDERQRIVDAVYKVALVEGWCSETEKALGVAFPDGSPWTDGKWRTSDGYDCRGWDVEGYTRDGYDRRGYNRAGVQSPEVAGTYCAECNTYH